MVSPCHIFCKVLLMICMILTGAAILDRTNQGRFPILGILVLDYKTVHSRNVTNNSSVLK